MEPTRHPQPQASSRHSLRSSMTTKRDHSSSGCAPKKPSHKTNPHNTTCRPAPWTGQIGTGFSRTVEFSRSAVLLPTTGRFPCSGPVPQERRGP
jgi:hypothetical protein